VKRLGEDLGSKSSRRIGKKAPLTSANDDDLIMRFDALPPLKPNAELREERSIRFVRRSLARFGIAWSPYNGTRRWKARWFCESGLYLGTMFVVGLACATLGVEHFMNPTTSTIRGNPAVPLAIGLGLIIFSFVIILRSARRIYELADGAIRFQWIRRSREIQPGELRAVSRLGVGIRARTLLPLVVRTTSGSFLLWPSMSEGPQLLKVLERNNPAADLSFPRDIWLR